MNGQNPAADRMTGLAQLDSLSTRHFARYMSQHSTDKDAVSYNMYGLHIEVERPYNKYLAFIYSWELE